MTWNAESNPEIPSDLSDRKERVIIYEGQVRSSGLTDTPLFEPQYHAVSYASKRIVDVTLSLLMLLIVAPLLLVIALLVKFSSRGPVIYQQTRVGQGGRLFTCYKFRTMFVDAEARLTELRHLNEASGPVFKIRNDPRIMPIGRLLRKTSFDELPQLFNILLGDMSVVGPRPALLNEVRTYGPRELMRLSVKPGLTCLSALDRSSDYDFSRAVELDILYIETMSPLLDLRIIVQSLAMALSARGAA